MDFGNMDPGSLGDEKTDVGLTAAPPADTDTGITKLQRTGIILFAIASFFFFVVMKLPEARIQNLIIAHIRIIAQEQGFLFSAEKVHVGLLFGPSLKMYNVELKSLENESQVLKIAYLKVRPRLLSLVSSVKKVGVTAEMLDGELSGTVGGSTTGSMAVDLSIDAIDLGASQIMKRFLPVEVSGKINGSIRLDLDSENTAKSEGAIKLSIDKLAMPPQAVSGFNLPKINISESKINLGISGGQLTITQFDLGKDIKTDDLVGKLTGSGVLNRYLDRSTIKATAIFSLSQGVKTSFPLLNALLSSALTSDGKYAYKFSGSLSALDAQPGQ
ncbi:MAG: type II secretion system protein GspN [Deltaproteobacteria bacterium]|nr:type II secretion system protein GspN [Deltaproteobacteria bacterium]